MTKIELRKLSAALMRYRKEELMCEECYLACPLLGNISECYLDRLINNIERAIKNDKQNG